MLPLQSSRQGERLQNLAINLPQNPRVSWLFPVQGWSRVKGKEMQPKGQLAYSGAAGDGGGFDALESLIRSLAEDRSRGHRSWCCYYLHEKPELSAPWCPAQGLGLS